MKQALHKRDQDTAIAWIRSHIGIPGNERVGRRAAYESALGVTAGSPHTATEEGLRAGSRATGRDDRWCKGFGERRSDWSRRALSAYTWLRTGRGPQKK